MPSGSCRCGAIRVKFTGDPLAVAACHCLDCRKISGSVYGLSLIVPDVLFEVLGSPSTFTAEADSGKEITNHFCDTCGVTLWADGPGTPLKFVKAGVLDDVEAFDKAKPVMELYTCRRAAWLPPLNGPQQKERM